MHISHEYISKLANYVDYYLFTKPEFTKRHNAVRRLQRRREGQKAELADPWRTTYPESGHLLP